MVLNYFFLYSVLTTYINEESTSIKDAIKDNSKGLALILIPLILIAVVFTFGRTLNTSSLGMTLIWGIIVAALYNLAFTVPLLNMVGGEKQNGE